MMDATVSPFSNTPPHLITPNPIKIKPHATVVHRESFTSFAGSVAMPRILLKSMIVEEASEFSAPERFDMPAAKIAAISNPTIPGGISRTTNSGKTRSLSPPTGTSGTACCWL